MKVYLVGVHCEYEGGGWDEVVVDNENLINNIKSIYKEYLKEKLSFWEYDLESSSESEQRWYKEVIKEFEKALEIVEEAVFLSQLKGVGMGSTDISTIQESKVYS